MELWKRHTEPVFGNVYGAQESIPPGYTNRVVVPARKVGIESWVLQRFTNTGSVRDYRVPAKRGGRGTPLAWRGWQHADI